MRCKLKTKEDESNVTAPDESDVTDVARLVKKDPHLHTRSKCKTFSFVWNVSKNLTKELHH